MKISPEICERIARAMKERNPSLTPGQIAEGITGLMASTPAQRLRWAMEERDRDRAAQKANESQPQAVRPEPIVQDRQAQRERPKDAKF
jgi:hypothetical protein